MSEILGSFATYFNTRLKTPFYGLLGFWWAVLHWEPIYTALFVNEENILKKTGLLKNEYLKQEYFQIEYLDWWLLQLLKLSVSVGLTWLMIWIIPKQILLPAFRAQKSHDFDKRVTKLEYERKEEKEKTKLEKQSVEKLKTSRKKINIEREIKQQDPTVLWQEEYERLTKQPLYARLPQIIDSLYRYNGQVTVPGLFRLDRDILAYADTNGLLNFDQTKNQISLTNKGKFFVKEYQSRQ